MNFLKHLFLLVVLCLVACTKTPETFDQLPLEEALERIASPLSTTPLEWADEDLTFVDKLAAAQIIGMGEATHGTKEFFQAKHRIFQYLAENHGFRVFAIEADMGESLFLNAAIQEGRTADIKELMKEKMLFEWVWKTEEVRQLLEWMSDYNKGKADSEKLQYVGIDCQVNDYYPLLLLDYLEKYDRALFELAMPILTEVHTKSKKQAGATQTELVRLVVSLNAFVDQFATKKEYLIEQSSKREFQLYEQLCHVMLQVLEVQKARNVPSQRDEFMATNVQWLLDYYPGDKVFLWAHDLHIGDIYENVRTYFKGGSMGHHLTKELGTAYQKIGFSFGEGVFNARQKISGTSSNPKATTLDGDFPEDAISESFSKVPLTAFAVEVAALGENKVWESSVTNGLTYLSIGAVFYPTNRQVHFHEYKQHYFDFIIHFKETTPTTLFN